MISDTKYIACFYSNAQIKSVYVLAASRWGQMGGTAESIDVWSRWICGSRRKYGTHWMSVIVEYPFAAGRMKICRFQLSVLDNLPAYNILGADTHAHTHTYRNNVHCEHSNCCTQASDSLTSYDHMFSGRIPMCKLAWACVGSTFFIPNSFSRTHTAKYTGTCISWVNDKNQFIRTYILQTDYGCILRTHIHESRCHLVGCAAAGVCDCVCLMDLSLPVFCIYRACVYSRNVWLICLNVVEQQKFPRCYDFFFSHSVSFCLLNFVSVIEPMCS